MAMAAAMANVEEGFKRKKIKKNFGSFEEGDGWI